MDRSTVFQRRLRAELDAREMPPGRLDRLARLAQGSSRRYLDGESEPSLRSLSAIADVFGMPVSQLLEAPTSSTSRRRSG